MLALRYAARWRIGGIALLALTLAAALAPLHLLWPATSGTYIPHLDKWLHGFTFAVLALWYTGQYAPRSYWRITAGLVAFGAVIELLQRMVAYRTADWLDLAADVAGLGLGMTLALAGTGAWSQRLEAWLQSRRG